MIERRKEPRVLVTVPLRVCDLGSGEVLGELVNLSRHGMLLLSQCLIEPNRVFQVEIPLPEALGFLGARLRLGIESLWYEPGEGNQYWVGFTIIDFAPEAIELLDRLIVQFS